jgi:hypothetical protein
MAFIRTSVFLFFLKQFFSQEGDDVFVKEGLYAAAVANMGVAPF